MEDILRLVDTITDPSVKAEERRLFESIRNTKNKHLRRTYMNKWRQYVRDNAPLSC